MSKKAKPSPTVSGEPQTDAKPFNQDWINSCYQQTLLPNAPWHKLEEEVSHNLAQKAEKQFNHPQRKEMLMDVLGKHFVEKYLAHVQRTPDLLEPGHMTAEERNRLKLDAQNWLNSQMHKAVNETGHKYLLTGLVPGEPPPSGNYAEFLQHTFGIFTNGLNRELYKQEQILTKSKADELNKLKKNGKADIYKVPAPSRIKPVGTAASNSTQSTVKPSTGQIRSLVHTVEGDPPPLWGPQSDKMGAAVASLLQRDPKKFEVVVGRLHGRQLPGTLRAYIWADVLFKGERKRMKEVYVEKVVRERFALAVTRGLTELRIKKPTQSPINGLIQNAVIETYSKTTSMVPFKHMEHMKESIRALNVLYVYDRSYEPYLIHWLFPLQLAFRNEQAMSDDMGEHVLELAMYLDMLNSNCFPSWPHVFAMAEQVMSTLQQQDPKLHDHLKRIAPINAQVNPKEFLVQLLHQEREKGEALMKTSTNTPRAASSSTQFLADPSIFLRRWIGEGFVSIVDTPCMMYLWDQMFMQSWRQSSLVNICLCLVELLRHRFMEAHDYVTMKEVFLMEPCKLYTVDVQMAWIHVENGKDILEINDLFNRQRPQSPESRMSADFGGRDSPPEGMLKPSGIKNIRTSLTFTADAISREPWLGSLKPEDIRLNVAVYFGSIKVRSRLSHSLPVITSMSQDSYGGTVVEMDFPGERYIYDMLDISQFDVERELGAYPYAIFKVESAQPHSSRKPGGPIHLGWSRIPLYRHSNQSFSVIEGDVTVSLHPGDIPDSFITTQPKTPSEEEHMEGSLIGYNCTLSAHVFDPNNEPQARAVRPAKPTSTVPPLVPPLDTRANPAPAPRRQPSVPPPPPPPQPEPTPPQTVRSPEVDPNPWVPYKAPAAKSDPKPTTNRDPFMLYIDSVRHIPDNATIVKVTGRILRAGDLTNLQDILAVPELESSARSPVFNFSMLVNEGRQVADPELLLFLRVYTYDVELKKVMVIGSCLVSVFSPGKKKKDGLLRVGGHQLRVYSGMPNMREGLNQITGTDLDNNTAVPACSMLVRLLPQSQSPVPAPSYTSGYYRSDSCKPTASEVRIFASYGDNLAKTERDMIMRLLQAERAPNINESQYQDWLVSKLDIKRQQGASQPAGNLALPRCVRYRVRVGLMAQIQSASGLPDGLYIQCFARVSPGKQAKYISPTEQGYGREEKFITTKLAPTSFLSAPVWEDNPKELHPFYDLHSCLLIQLIGLRVLYRPRADHKQVGTLHKPDGSPLEITSQELIGWAVVPLFDGNSVVSGMHQVPVLSIPLKEEITEELSQTAAHKVLDKRVWTDATRLPGASLTVMVWDAHFDPEDLPEKQTHSSLLAVTGTQASEAPAAGTTQQEMLLNMLEQKARKQGLKGTIFKKEQQFFTDAATLNFKNLMDDYCLTNGFAPL
ncbi:uncharacterized protein LOC101850990 [Aplysia californica]|uniref:Uncharacterized protein LOC101850990 n=1 Tax=Aplysia californica TaxID=6500 RepID=A0ABM1W109_APLCA|nr:uncharacterized protein LOC101850990 [Aplysia californica]